MPSASRPKALTPTTISCAGWRASISGPQKPTARRYALFYRAIEFDASFASAYAMAAWCYAWRKINGWMTDRTQEIAEGARLARRALELGKDDAVALARGGHALGFLVGELDMWHRVP